MTMACETSRKRNFCNLHFRMTQQPCHSPYPLRNQVLSRRGKERLFEGGKELVNRHVKELGKVAELERLRKVVKDEFSQFVHLVVI